MAPSWQATALATAALALAAAPLAYYRWQRSIEEHERQQALRLLRKVELIVSEVAVRLMHLENQVEDFVAFKNRSDDGDAEEDEGPDSTLNSYYHFDSKGNKLKTKWDSYDVDAELEKLDQEDTSESVASTAASSTTATKRRPAAPAMSKMKLLSAAGGIEHEFEAVLEFLDDVRGDEQVKQLRKSIVTKITKEQFTRIDQLRVTLGFYE